MEFDSFDRSIIGLLQQSNTTPYRVIGERVNLSAASVHRRIKRMEEEGIIEANVAIFDPTKLGQRLTIVVEVELISEQINFIDEAKMSFRSAPEVQQCYYVTGETDFILILTVGSMSEYESLARRLFFNNSNIQRFRSFVTVDRVKVGLSIPI